MVVAQILLTCQVKHESQEINKKVESSRNLPCGLQPCSFHYLQTKETLRNNFLLIDYKILASHP